MEERIKGVIAAVLELKPAQIHEGTDFKVLWNWDSLKHINLVLALEDEFQVQFTDEEISRMVTYADVKQIVTHVAASG